MNKKVLTAAGAVFLILVLGGAGYVLLSKPGADPRRTNILKLAKDYADQAKSSVPSTYWTNCSSPTLTIPTRRPSKNPL